MIADTKKRQHFELDLDSRGLEDLLEIPEICESESLNEPPASSTPFSASPMFEVDSTHLIA